ncbi:MAG: hypothetical protein IPP79_08060 [Chitinophagaceae bacterium]|nr:hypothetical protein [Chitinophagaceae bacterium]
MKRTLLFIFLLSICSKNAKTQGSNSGVINTRFTSRHFTIADGLPQIQITRLFNDSKGFVWVGTKFGLYVGMVKKFKVFTPKKELLGNR